MANWSRGYTNFLNQTERKNSLAKIIRKKILEKREKREQRKEGENDNNRIIIPVNRPSSITPSPPSYPALCPSHHLVHLMDLFVNDFRQAYLNKIRLSEFSPSWAIFCPPLGILFHFFLFISLGWPCLQMGSYPHWEAQPGELPPSPPWTWCRILSKD